MTNQQHLSVLNHLIIFISEIARERRFDPHKDKVYIALRKKETELWQEEGCLDDKIKN